MQLCNLLENALGFCASHNLRLLIIMMMVWLCSKLLAIKIRLASYLWTVGILHSGWCLEMHFDFLEIRMPTVSEIVKRSWMGFWEVEMLQSREFFVSLLPLDLELNVLPLNCCESWTRCAFILLYLQVSSSNISSYR